MEIACCCEDAKSITISVMFWIDRLREEHRLAHAGRENAGGVFRRVIALPIRGA